MVEILCPEGRNHRQSHEEIRPFPQYRDCEPEHGVASAVPPPAQQPRYPQDPSTWLPCALHWVGPGGICRHGIPLQNFKNKKSLREKHTGIPSHPYNI